MSLFDLFVTSQLGPGTISSYRAQLPQGDSAILTLVAAGGWHLAVRRHDGTIEDRGLFGNPVDAISLLKSEYGAYGMTDQAPQ
ncbi:MAG TPA: hypothetical protein VEA16_23445 [Vicinamibacterales bacterium]|nr:hypothetical protein [Vicinamibacterales bacterium]